MSLSQHFLDDLRDRVAVSSVIGRSLKLERKGREFLALCPFHADSKPSLSVVDNKGFYHCFACGAHGDVFKFLMENDGLKFLEAVEHVAGLAGVEVPASSPQERERIERHRTLQDVVDLACRWYERQLHSAAGEDGLAYLRSRGLADETIASFRLGWAPADRMALQRAMKVEGVDADVLVEAGLVRRFDDGERAGETVDVMRGRVLFPIADRRGRVIAFGGRVLGDGEPKYLNSPDTPLFHKGRVLYGLAQAREPAHKSGELPVVEGYMDVLALAEAGVPAVAPLGTALTDDQLAELWRVVPEPILCLDGDTAGRKAARRAGERALPLLEPGRSLRVALLGQGTDPDDLVRAGGGEAVRAVLSDAVGLAGFLWESSIEGRELGTPERRAGFYQEMRSLAQTVKNPVVRQAYHDDFEARILALRGPSSGGEPNASGESGVDAERCPVTVLGIDQDNRRWYVSPSGRLNGLLPTDHGKLNLLALFDGTDRWLYEHFPTTDKEGGVNGWNGFSATRWLIQQSVRAGGFSLRHSLRGAGTWRATREDGTDGLIVHCGDVLVVDGKPEPTGRRGAKIYPTLPPLPRPAEDALSVSEGKRLRAFFQAAPWHDPEWMAIVALGALGAAYLPGALTERPPIHVGGDKGAGKSSILKFFTDTLAEWGEAAADYSEPAIRGMLSGGARAILLDEVEREELKEKGAQIVKLARISWSDTSGGSARGTRDGGVTSTPMKAMFFMASIIPPPMAEADVDRFTYLALRHASPIPPLWAKALGEADALTALGPKIHRRMIDSWPRLQALIPRLKQSLDSGGHQGRSPVNLSVLAACAEVLTSDEAVDDMDLAQIIAPFDPVSRAEQVDDRPGYERCLTKMLTSPVPDWRDGVRRTVAELLTDEIRHRDTAGNGEQFELRRIGLRVVRLTDKQAPPGRMGEVGLAVANDTEGLASLFEGSAWAGGGWVATLRNAPDVCTIRQPVRFTVLQRATFVPIDLLGLRVDDEGGDA